MNHFTFAHKTTMKNILVAMRNAQKWGIDHVVNRKGAAFLAVRFQDGEYSITDSKGACAVTPIRYAAIRHGTARRSMYILLQKRADKTFKVGKKRYGIEGQQINFNQ